MLTGARCGARARGRKAGATSRIWASTTDYVLAWAPRRRSADEVHVVYVDPPFATGNHFSYDVKVGDVAVTKQPSIIEETAYRDTWESYAPFIYERMPLARELLKPSGSIYRQLDPTVGHYAEGNPRRGVRYRIIPTCEIVCRIGWISGYKSKAQNWIRNHDLIYYYTQDPSNFTFNKEYVPYAAEYKRSR